ncbi:MAG TPA: adenylate/guanylate cyclase domain-containing protein [Dehalococcoidia bacterium]|nr:adenylate/guanylate cyclase domain-containing protein [Dehalococcoidia bacterium]
MRTLSGRRLGGMRWETWIWVVIIGLTFVSVSLGLMNVPESAIEYWYLYASPLLLAAYRFGLRGALLGSAVSLLFIIGFYEMAQAYRSDDGTLLRDLQDLASSTTSAQELRALATQIADLRDRDPYIRFVRAVSGMILLVVSAILVGLLFDKSRQQEAENRRAAQQLRRFFAPKLVDAIMTGQSTVGLTSQRKDLAVLFADLRGFTSLSERLEPEELSRLLNEYLETMTDVLDRHGGTLDKYLGDGILAFFGDPIVQPDAEVKALQAAIAMRDHFYELRDRWFQQGREAVQLGIGVHSGFMTVGTFGSNKLMSYTVIGGNVNLAARLSDLAEPGQILTSQRTYFKARHMVEGQPIGELPVKGMSQPVGVVSVVGNRFLPLKTESTADREARWEALIERLGADPAYRYQVICQTEQALEGIALDEEHVALTQRIALLQGYPLLQGVPAAEIRELMHLVSVESYANGLIAGLHGDPIGGLKIIDEGEVLVFGPDADRRETHIATFGRGDYFGTYTSVEGLPLGSRFRAVGKLELLVLDAEKLEALLKTCPGLRRNLESTSAPTSERLRRIV